jgi:hypothetical protein
MIEDSGDIEKYTIYGFKAFCMLNFQYVSGDIMQSVWSESMTTLNHSMLLNYSHLHPLLITEIFLYSP